MVDAMRSSGGVPGLNVTLFELETPSSPTHVKFDGVHPLAAPSDRKGPYAGADQTLGKWFPHNTSIAWRSQGRETQGSPKDDAL